MPDLVLPAFHLDCRDWLVVVPEEAGLPEEADGPPVLAVLSTVVIDDGRFRAVRCVLTVGLLDTNLPSRSLGGGSVARCLLDEASDESRRYLMAAPDGYLAVVADVEFDGRCDPAEIDRAEMLMRSFRWAG